MPSREELLAAAKRKSLIEQAKAKASGAQQESEVATLPPAEDASFGEQAGEFGRSFARGGQQLAEGYLDMADPAIMAGRNVVNSAMQGELPSWGKMYGEIGNELNPFGEQGELDQWRQENLWDPISSFTEERLDTSETPLLQAAKTGAEWGVGMLGPGKVKEVADMAVGSAGGAALFEYLGNKVGQGEITETVGGIVSALLSGQPRKILEKQYNNEYVDRAVDFIRENATDVDDMVTKLRVADETGEAGTLADLAQDPNLYNLEHNVSGADFQHKLRDIEGERGQQIATEVQGQFGTTPGGPQMAQDTIDAQRAQIEGAGEAQKIEVREQLPQAQALEQTLAMESQKAQDVADIATDAATVPTAPSDASKVVSAKMDQLDNILKERYQKPAWEKFDAADQIMVEPIKGNLKAAMNEALTNTQSADMKNQFGSVFKLIDKWESSAKPSEVHYVIQKIKSIVNNAEKMGGKGPEHGALIQVGKSLEDSLQKTQYQDLYNEAVTTTADRYARTKPGRVGEVRDLKEPQTLGRDLLKRFEEGALTGDDIQAMESPAINAQVENYLMSVANRDGFDKLLSEYGEFLDRFPNIKQKFTAAQEAQGSAAAASTAAKTQTEATNALPNAIKTQTDQIDSTTNRLTKSVDKTVLADYAKEPKATVKKVINSPDQAGLETLIYSVGDEGADALRTDIGEAFMEKIAKTEAGDFRLDYKSIDQFEKSKPMLEKIMSPEEIKTLGDTLQRTRMDWYRKQSAPVKIKQLESEFQKLAPSVAAAGVVGMLPGTQSLLVGGAVRRYFNNIFNKKGIDPKVEAILDEIVLNPTKFIEALAESKTRTEKDLQGFMRMYMGAVASGQEQESAQGQ